MTKGLGTGARRMARADHCHSGLRASASEGKASVNTLGAAGCGGTALVVFHSHRLVIHRIG